jgi:hypothetical protein
MPAILPEDSRGIPQFLQINDVILRKNRLRLFLFTSF